MDDRTAGSEDFETVKVELLLPRECNNEHQAAANAGAMPADDVLRRNCVTVQDGALDAPREDARIYY